MSNPREDCGTDSWHGRRARTSADGLGNLLSWSSVHCSNPDETQYPSNFDDEVVQRATAAFDWAALKEESEKEERSMKCINNMRAILNSRRLVCEQNEKPHNLSSKLHVSGDRIKVNVCLSAHSFPVGSVF